MTGAGPPGARGRASPGAVKTTGANTPPTGWRVNGVACSVAGQPPAVVAEPDTVMIPESGGGSFAVRLSHPPAQQVSLQMSISGTGTWASQPVVFVFTPTNWSTARQYPIMSMPDDDTVEGRAVGELCATGCAPDTGGVFVLTLRDDRVAAMDVTLNAPPPPPRSV